MDNILLTDFKLPTDLQNLVCVLTVILFINARGLVRSVVVFYTGGVLFGILASVLMFGFFIQRLIPSSVKFPFIFGGWPISAYIYYITWQNLGTILRDYQFYAAIYLCFFTLLSLAICYRIGPPVDDRSINLLEWTLQLISLVLIYFIIQNRKVAITIITLLVFYLIWRGYSRSIQKSINKFFIGFRDFIFGPQPRRLLSQQEYLDESKIYTRMELDKLRQFCQSQDPKNNWRLISRLHTPNKVASFITGDNDHVSMLENSTYCNLYDYENDGDSEENSKSDSDRYITDDD